MQNTNVHPVLVQELFWVAFGNLPTQFRNGEISVVTNESHLHLYRISYDEVTDTFKLFTQNRNETSEETYKEFPQLLQDFHDSLDKSGYITI